MISQGLIGDPPCWNFNFQKPWNIDEQGNRLAAKVLTWGMDMGMTAHIIIRFGSLKLVPSQVILQK